MLRVNKNAGLVDETKAILSRLTTSNGHVIDSDLACDLAKVYREMLGDDMQAEKLLLENLASEDFDINVFSDLFTLLTDLERADAASSLLAAHRSEITQQYELQLRRGLAETKKDYKHAIEILKDENTLEGSSDQSSLPYLLILNKDYEEAKKVCQARLIASNYSIESITDIVNFELSKKLLGNKPDNQRLDKLLDFDSSASTKAVVAALRGQKTTAIDHIRDELAQDKTYRFNVAKWPVFSEIKDDPQYLNLIKNYTSIQKD